MTIAQTDLLTPQKPLRLWPGVLLAVLQPLSWFVVPAVFPEAGFYGLLGAVACAFGIVLWWLFFSRALWSERLGAIVLMTVALFVTSRILHISVAKVGQGMLFMFYAPSLMMFAFAVAVLASHRFGNRVRRAVMAATILLASGGWGLVRIGGISMTGGLDIAWRWSPTPEEQLLAQATDEPVLPPPVPAPTAVSAPAKRVPAGAGDKSVALRLASAVTETVADWPGFRGPHRDSVIRGVQIAADWPKSPPVELWRRPVGPAWSSFAVHGGLLYTQEQRGDAEIVSCYKVTTGEPVWRHRSTARFWQAQGGAGPRATPTLHSGRVYALGATGILVALDAATGTAVWSRNAGTDAEVKIPFEGFASSPLVVNDIVVVAAAGRLVAYDLATGEPRWFGPKAGRSYSSPHLLTIDGVPQILLMSGAGATSVSPTDGKPLWERAWPVGDRIVQPALASASDILMTTGGEAAMGDGGLARIAVAHGANGWTVEDRWTSRGLKPSFNDFVVHKGHAYGFDGSILACIDLQDGTRKWKGGRYGNGQLVLLADQDLLLVLSEEGELALVSATPDEFKELARFPAIKGKTWNHPVLVGDVLLVRNDREMAAFRLSLAGAK